MFYQREIVMWCDIIANCPIKIEWLTHKFSMKWEILHRKGTITTTTIKSIDKIVSIGEFNWLKKRFRFGFIEKTLLRFNNFVIDRSIDRSIDLWLLSILSHFIGDLHILSLHIVTYSLLLYDISHAELFCVVRFVFFVHIVSFGDLIYSNYC